MNVMGDGEGDIFGGLFRLDRQKTRMYIIVVGGKI